MTTLYCECGCDKKKPPFTFLGHFWVYGSRWTQVTHDTNLYMLYGSGSLKSGNRTEPKIVYYPE